MGECSVHLQGRNSRVEDGLRAADAVHDQQPFLGKAPVRVLQELALQEHRRGTAHGLTGIAPAGIHDKNVQSCFLLARSLCRCFQPIAHSCLRIRGGTREPLLVGESCKFKDFCRPLTSMPRSSRYIRFYCSSNTFTATSHAPHRQHRLETSQVNTKEHNSVQHDAADPSDQLCYRPS